MTYHNIFCFCFRKQKYEISSVDSTKLSLSSVPETQGFRSQLIPKYNVFDRKFLFVFRPQDKNQNAKNAKYLYVSTDVKDTNNLNYVPKVPEKFAKQNLNILKLPYKFNELKHKSDKNINVNSNNNCYSIINPVTLDSNTSFKKI